MNWKCREHLSFSGTARTVLSLLLVLQLVFLLVLVACPALHHAIHHDSDRSDHQCAVTVFAHGQVDSSVVAVNVNIPVTAVEFLPQALISILNTQVDTFPPGRGPPADLFVS